MSLAKHKGAILDALDEGRRRGRKAKGREKPAALNREQAWRDIQAAVNLFKDNGTPVTGKARREHYDGLISDIERIDARLEKSLETPGLIDPLAWVQGGEPDEGAWHDAEAEIRANREKLDEFKRRAMLARDEAASTVRRGRPSGSNINRLVWVLAPIYEHHTGSRATYSRPVEESQYYEDKSGPASGPFIRFISTLATALRLSCTREGIAGALNSCRKNPAWKFNFYQPVPDPELAGAFIRLIDRDAGSELSR